MLQRDLQCTVSSFSSSYQSQHQNNSLDPSSHSPRLANAPQEQGLGSGKKQRRQNLKSPTSLPFCHCQQLCENSTGAKHNRVYFSTVVYWGVVYTWNQCRSSVPSTSCLPAVRLNVENICHCQIPFLSSNLSHKMPWELLPISPQDFFLHFPLQCATSLGTSFQSEEHFPTASPTPTLPFSTHHSLSPSPFLLFPLKHFEHCKPHQNNWL